MYANPKKKGLGVKDLELFNIAVLNIWKWIIINDRSTILRELLEYRYDQLWHVVELGSWTGGGGG